MIINKIEDIKDYNILLDNIEQADNCFELLESLRFKVSLTCLDNPNNIIISFYKIENVEGRFFARGKFLSNKVIHYKNFKRQAKRLIKERDEKTIKNDMPVVDNSFSEAIEVPKITDDKKLIEYIKNNKVAIHCPTQEGYNRLTELLEKNGEVYSYSHKNFSEINDYWKNHKEETCLSSCFGKYGYCYKSFYKKYSCKIITVKELFDKFNIMPKINEYLTTHEELVKNVGRKVSCYIDGNYIENGIIYLHTPNNIMISQSQQLYSISCNYLKVENRNGVSKIKLIPQDDIYEFRSDLLNIDINKTKYLVTILKNNCDYKINTINLAPKQAILCRIKELEVRKSKGEFDKKPDIEVAKDGRVKKINDWNGRFLLYFINYKDSIYDFRYEDSKLSIQKNINYGLVFSTAESRDKAVNRMKIETQLKNISDELNEGVAIDFNSISYNKYYITYHKRHNKLALEGDITEVTQGTIYCISINFLEVAINEIGEQELINYFKGE